MSSVKPWHQPIRCQRFLCFSKCELPDFYFLHIRNSRASPLRGRLRAGRSMTKIRWHARGQTYNYITLEFSVLNVTRCQVPLLAFRPYRSRGFFLRVHANGTKLITFVTFDKQQSRRCTQGCGWNRRHDLHFWMFGTHHGYARVFLRQRPNHHPCCYIGQKALYSGVRLK